MALPKKTQTSYPTAPSATQSAAGSVKGGKADKPSTPEERKAKHEEAVAAHLADAERSIKSVTPTVGQVGQLRSAIAFLKSIAPNTVRTDSAGGPEATAELKAVVAQLEAIVDEVDPLPEPEPEPEAEAAKEPEPTSVE